MNIVMIEPISDNIGQTLANLTQFKSQFIKLPIIEDPVISVGSNFSSFGDKFPTVSSITNTLAFFQGGGGGNVSAGLKGIKDKLDSEHWTGTNPIELQLKLAFYSEVQGEKPFTSVSGAVSSLAKNVVASKTGVLGDLSTHWIHKVNQLISYSVMSLNKNGSYSVPGVSVKDMPLLNHKLSDDPLAGVNARTEADTSGSKMISVLIPGIVLVPYAVIQGITLTYSKNVTTLGYPLWCNADVKIKGIVPATDSNFSQGAQQGKAMSAIGQTELFSAINSSLK